MTRLLTPDQVAAYERDGFCFPIDVLGADEVRQYRGELEAWERARGAPIDFPEKSKSYMLFDWADQLVHHPRILDAVEDVIGPDILVYHSTLFLKEAHTPAYVRWHQDSTYFYLAPHLHVTEGNEAARRLYTDHGFEPTGAWEPLRPGSHLRIEELALRRG